jgi:hypothetical protein
MERCPRGAMRVFTSGKRPTDDGPMTSRASYGRPYKVCLVERVCGDS